MDSNYHNLIKEILCVINEKKPQSVIQLVQIVRGKNYDLTEEELIKLIMKMQAERLIKLSDQVESNSFMMYVVSPKVIWYWITIAISVTTLLLFFVPLDSIFYPLIYARNILGLIFILFLPGYACVRAFFPITRAEFSLQNLMVVERIALSIGLSIVLVSMISLFVYFSPFGLDLSAIVLSLFVFTFFLMTALAIKEYNAEKHHLDKKL